MKRNKPNPKTTPATTANLTPLATTHTQAPKTQAQKPPKKKKKTTTTEALPPFPPTPPTPPSGAREAAANRIIAHTMAGELESDQPYESTAARHSERLNTNPKRRIRQGLMDTLCDK
jgi:hypothetical protein